MELTFGSQTYIHTTWTWEEAHTNIHFGALCKHYIEIYFFENLKL